MELTEKQREQKIKELKKRLSNFPKENERKDDIFKSLNNILQALGSYLNDDKLEFVRETKDDKEYLIYKSIYGIAKQDITGDSVKTFFEDSLKLLLANCRELQGTFSVIKNALENK